LKPGFLRHANRAISWCIEKESQKKQKKREIAQEKTIYDKSKVDIDTMNSLFLLFFFPPSSLFHSVEAKARGFFRSHDVRIDSIQPSNESFL